MKKNNLQRFLALLLASLLLMGAMTSLAAFADEVVDGEEEIPETTVSIAYKNVAYEAATKLVFYVESANLPEGAYVSLAIFDDVEGETAEGTLYSSFGKLSVEGVEYDAFASDEIDYKNLRKNFYVMAVVIDADDNVIAQSDVLTYSVFDYCMDRFEKTPTADQKALYKALLDFGASVQAITYDDSNIDEVGGWADAYYGVKVENVIGEDSYGYKKYYFSARDFAAGNKQTIIVDSFLTNGTKKEGVFASATGDKIMQVSNENNAVSFNLMMNVGFSNIQCSYIKAVATTAFNDMANNTKTAKWAFGNTDIKGAGVRYLFSMKYMYNGLSAFNIDPATGAVTVNSGSDSTFNYGFPRIYGYKVGGSSAILLDGDVKRSGEIVDADKNIVVKDGVLVNNSGITSGSEMFYEKLSWHGFTFEIGKEYEIVFDITINDGAKPTIVITVTDEEGNVKSLEKTAAFVAEGIDNFTFEYRGSGYVGTYTNNQSFSDVELMIFSLAE